jgi:hypothetical protein
MTEGFYPKVPREAGEDLLDKVGLASLEILMLGLGQQEDQ